MAGVCIYSFCCNAMNAKNDILDAWIMVESLSEGDIQPERRDLMQLSEGSNYPDNDFCSLFKTTIAENAKNMKAESLKSSGIVVYFDIFDFNDVIEIIRDKYGLEPTQEEINKGYKFSFAVYFDNNLEYISDLTFLTMSAYIKYNRTLPESNKAFTEYGSEFKQSLDNIFSNIDNDPACFNNAILKLLYKHDIAIKNCRFSFVKNVNSDIVNLHSFFIDDLVHAQSIDTVNLNAYLNQAAKSNRINLDSNSNSENFNPNVFTKILHPICYPAGRFPSNTAYALAFMQQTAVNIIIGDNSLTIQSVNGPPGTGKTTLLKDIFAELVVQQAYAICNMSHKALIGNEKTRYYKNHTIGTLPACIADNNIVVASSNNGAVKNIVDELPLISGIDSDLIESLEEADYFKDIANGKADDNDEAADKPDLYWGLFSMEGGKSSNMQNILKNLTAIFANLCCDYVSDDDIYKDFLSSYNNIVKYRHYIANIADTNDHNYDVNHLDMSLGYDSLQQSNPWYSSDYRVDQSVLFAKAMAVRKQFLSENRDNIEAAVRIWQHQNSYVETNPNLISIAWNWINFTIPVISTTFASMNRMCRNLGENTIGHLFIDEAGQATPQAGVGAVYRSKKVIAVGDPSQIKPVLTLDSNVLALLRKNYNIDERYLSDDASVQTLIDAVSPYGFYKSHQDCDTDSWIGIPLWVHRRCQYPMFDIANKLSYNGLMVQGNPGYGKTGWFDVKGKADNKYVKEQGEFLKNKIKQMSKTNPDILDKTKKDVIYVITPFANVAKQLAKELNNIGFTRYSGSKATNVGTIHTFQGKEAPIVFMVLGADERSKGSASWAVSEPNMMNVAATRAKKEFYIIGDKKLYVIDTHSSVAYNTNQEIQRYKKDHPELIDDNVNIVSVPSSNNSPSSPISSQKPVSDKKIVGKCPRCGNDVIENGKAYSCKTYSCGFCLWKHNTYNDIDIDAKAAAELIKTDYAYIDKKTSNGIVKTLYRLKDTGKYVNLYESK
ncbi:MAG: AAA domain-containing protein [Erysipelotrichaceae bacterium]|nr:AAA domain-containing protein [Erysipelotrichaceae bacterium]